jgi:hypothetical protein
MESNRTYAIFDRGYMRSNLRNYKAVGLQDETAQRSSFSASA